jgi:uncharacterized membrane protein (DUF2068 family)
MLVGAIGVFKLVKSAVLFTVGTIGLAAPRSTLVTKAEEAISWLGWTAGRRALGHGVSRLATTDPATLHRLAWLALAYGAVFLVEGVGLVLEQRWAEWLTVGVTASFIPVEVFELSTHPGAGKVATLVLNLAIVGYLVWVRLRERRGLRRLSPA